MIVVGRIARWATQVASPDALTTNDTPTERRVDAKQLITLYFEADRSLLRKQYEDLFSVPDEQKDDLTQDVEGESPSERKTFKNQPNNLSDESLDAEFRETLRLSGVSIDLCADLEERWNLFDTRSKVEALWNLDTLFSKEFTLDYSWEGITKFFTVHQSSGFLHALFSEEIFPLLSNGSQELSYLNLRQILDQFGIQFDDSSKGLTDFEVWRNLSQAVQDFGATHELEPWQMISLVYDLGPRLLPQPGPYPIDPPPQVWVVATNDTLGEFEEIDEHGPEFCGTWAINRKAKRGDMALMYCVAPRSAIVSVYRIVEDAHRDPFGGWTGYRAKIAEKIAIPWIKFSELKANPVLKEWKLVKGNFQGLLQVPVPAAMWQRLLEMIAERDPMTGERLIQFKDAGKGVREIKVGDEKWSEKEVEDQFVIPILQRIGWKVGSTLVQQVPMQIKVGSGKPKEVYADFVGYHGAFTSRALMVVEAKRKIGSTRDLQQAVEQAESYAGKQRCNLFAIAAPEGFWLYQLQFPTQSRQLHALEFSIADIEKIANQIAGVIGYDCLCSSVP